MFGRLRLLSRGALAASAGAALYGAASLSSTSSPAEAKSIPHVISKDGTEKHRIVVVGGGAGGLSVAAMLTRKIGANADVAVIEPSDWHYYQPMWTMVAGGLVPVEKSRRPMGSVMPPDVTWLKQEAAGFEPEKSTVVLGDGTRVKYDYLIVATGLKIDWAAIKGLPEAIGHDGVASVYDYKFSDVVWNNVQALTRGTAIFTQPSTGVKCGGAPQKVMWLAEDFWRLKALCREHVSVEFYTGLPKMFAIPKYEAELERLREERGVSAHFRHELVEVDGKKKVAYFVTSEGKRVAKAYDFLHVTPKMGPPPCVRNSKLADPSTGFVEVDKETLQHSRFKNVFGIGDCTNLPTSKTAAAITAQAPVLVHNVLKTMDKKEPTARYDGYTSCPILTSRGKLILAEFKYGGVPKETFGALGSFFNQAKEYSLFYYLKTVVFPFAYWNLMLQGRWYGTRTIFEPKFD